MLLLLARPDHVFCGGNSLQRLVDMSASVFSVGYLSVFACCRRELG